MASSRVDPFSGRGPRAVDEVVLRVDGDLDIVAAPALRQALHELIDVQGHLSVTLDVADVSFLDSTGVSVLLGGIRRIRERGGEMTLANPSRSTLRVLEVAGLSGMFTITRDRDQVDGI